MFFVPLLTAEGSPAGGPASVNVIFILGLVAITYFFIIRPQNKKQKEIQKMLEALKKGDKVITLSGIHGIVSATKEKTVILKVDEGVKIEFNRSAIAAVVTDNPPAKSDKKSDKKAEESKKEEEKTESSDSSKAE